MAILSGCNPEKASAPEFIQPVKPAYGHATALPEGEVLYDKVLGALVGSAIGDAMGASTEMWHRTDIRRTYGYINNLTPAVRNQSPEGTWDHNLGAGATTDDTRWKALMSYYLEPAEQAWSAASFASHIVDFYGQAVGGIDTEKAALDPDLLEAPLEQVDWIREWARVALAYQQGPEPYHRARDRFYGGEMSCAGMLYTPVFGLVSRDPLSAYELAFEHTLFDIGYARDISALLAAMTRTAVDTRNMDSILNTAVFTDPLRYQDSRLVGRISLQTAQRARDQVRRALQMEPNFQGPVLDSLLRNIPEGYPGSPSDWVRQEAIYTLLEKDQEAIPFHAGEIWQILIAGLEFGQGDFEKTMAFIVNYGRDNDTVAAVAGMILGASLGYEELPESTRETVLKVNREQLGIDLEAAARRISGYSSQQAH
ncbi:ADP-ribosylglycohydrolase family protein [Robiginitalea sediminis]|uniref:ADP-ribosylglycohydrolase family protein n=1 Tax=Robiginitalea sediminis TaxID=1982593 RepID=UPI001E58B47F|nr:ADP-ribosylglycohydrolase family protein [Robiginitalea sediminis]